MLEYFVWDNKDVLPYSKQKEQTRFFVCGNTKLLSNIKYDVTQYLPLENFEILKI